MATAGAISCVALNADKLSRCALYWADAGWDISRGRSRLTAIPRNLSLLGSTTTCQEVIEQNNQYNDNKYLNVRIVMQQL